MDNELILPKDIKNKAEGSLQTGLGIIPQSFVCVKMSEKEIYTKESSIKIHQYSLMY